MPTEEQLKLELQVLHETLAKISGLTDGLPDPQFRWKESAEEFSLLETICHLRDLEVEGYSTRIARILAENSPFLPDIDGSRLAMERSYNSQDPAAALLAFTQARMVNLDKLKPLSLAQLEREGTLEGVGTVTLRRLIEMIQEHDEGHLEELSIMRRRLERRYNDQAMSAPDSCPSANSAL